MLKRTIWNKGIKIRTGYSKRFTLIRLKSCSISWRLPNCTVIFNRSFASSINLTWCSWSDDVDGGGNGNGGGGDDCIVAPVGQSVTNKKKKINLREKKKWENAVTVITP